VNPGADGTVHDRRGQFHDYAGGQFTHAGARRAISSPSWMSGRGHGVESEPVD
jgi:hypothetical protein